MSDEPNILGSGVGTTLGSGIYITSNKDDSSKGISAIDYAGGKFTKGKKGIITTFKFTPSDNVLYTHKQYYLQDLIEDEKLKLWFKQRLQNWLNSGWHKNGLKGHSLVHFIQVPPPGYGKKADIGEAGFDAIIALEQDGTIYEGAVKNMSLLKTLSREEVSTGN